MASQRIEYIDYLKGLTVVLVVWFHSSIHPSFLDFPFRMPLFFFVSGVFFKSYSWDVFWRKKVNQLVIPFLFFIGLALAYDIVRDFTSWSSVLSRIGRGIADLFVLHDQSRGLTYNPPLWFIMSLIDIQLMLYLLKRVVSSPLWLLVISFAITVFGELWFQWQPTPFMLGDACGHFFYYVAGNVTGRYFMQSLESNVGSPLIRRMVYGLIAVCFGAWLVEKAIVKFSLLPDTFPIWIIRLPWICALIPLCIIAVRRLYKLPVLAFLKFFGLNSYVVLGTHWIIIRDMIERDIYGHLLGRAPGGFESFALVVLTLCVVALLIVVFNRYVPFLVAKKDVIPVNPLSPGEVMPTTPVEVRQ